MGFFPNYFSIESDNLSFKGEPEVSNLWLVGKLKLPLFELGIRGANETIFLGSNPAKNYARTYPMDCMDTSKPVNGARHWCEHLSGEVSTVQLLALLLLWRWLLLTELV